MEEYGKTRIRPPFLPLGSAVTLKEGTKRIMITGRGQRRGQDEKVYDYCAVLWPEGQISSSEQYLFNEEAIDQVWFVGLQDKEEFAFRTYLEQEMHRLAGLSSQDV